MHQEEIKAALRMKGVTQAVLAERLGVNRSSVSQTISGSCKAERIQSAIAKIIGKTVKEIWPNQIILRRTKRPAPQATVHQPA